MPTPEFLQRRPTRQQIIDQVTTLNLALRGTDTRLPPQFDRPGPQLLDCGPAVLSCPERRRRDPDLDIPPITGLVVIPGNVAFLNQFFSVLLMVTNVAPDGTPLELRETRARIVLPTGRDRVAGSYDVPGDDPLRLARIDGIGIQPEVAVVQRGPDGNLGTADDIAFIPAQRSAEGEFLVEGLQEGSHLFDLVIDATLFGLPSGPVRLQGQAAGAVFVRNPTFAVTLAHPRTIRAGEPYDLYATVTNTSQSPANLVRVNLDPLGICGAQLLSDPVVQFEAIAPGQAVTARFRLLAQRTGEVTFSSFTGETAGGGIRLTTGIDERGVALAPNAIVLPKSADHLPAALVLAAQRVLGQAFSVATAPAEALPEGVVFVRRQTVIDHGVDLALAGERIGFGEPIGRAVQDLLLDWLGNDSFDAGFDQILRTTEAGAAFLSEVAAVIQADADPPLDYQAVRGYGGRSCAASVCDCRRHRHRGADAVGPACAGRCIGRFTQWHGAVADVRGPPRADRRQPSVPADRRRHRRGRSLTIRFVARAAGPHDLGIVVPGSAPGTLNQLRFPGLTFDSGGTAEIVIDLAAASPAILRVDRDGNGQVDENLAPAVETIVEQPPAFISARQLASSFRDGPGDPRDPATYGVLVAALFDKPVTEASAELRTNYAIEGNAVIGAQLQASGRLVYLYLQQPVGGLVPRSLTISGVTDARGHVLPATTQPILMALSDGARVFGQVRNADSTGVPGSVLKLSVSIRRSPSTWRPSAPTPRAASTSTSSRVSAPSSSRRSIRVTRDIASLSARIRGQGEQLLLNPTFAGRGNGARPHARQRRRHPGGERVRRPPPRERAGPSRVRDDEATRSASSSSPTRPSESLR